jgi:acetate kinase
MSNVQAGTSSHQHDFEHLSVENTVKAVGTDPDKGLGARVFAANIGENAPVVRAQVCEKLAWLGVTLGAAANDNNGPRITAADSRVSVWVIPTNEELRIARHTLALAPPVSA